MRELIKLDKYFIEPNLRFYGGFKYDGEDIMLCDDTDTEEDYSCNVYQFVQDDVLKTKITKEFKMKNGKNVKEESYLEIELEKDQILVYVERQGFVLPEYNMITLDKVVDQYNILGGATNDTIGNEEEGTSSN